MNISSFVFVKNKETFPLQFGKLSAVTLHLICVVCFNDSGGNGACYWAIMETGEGGLILQRHTDKESPWTGATILSPEMQLGTIFELWRAPRPDLYAQASCPPRLQTSHTDGKHFVWGAVGLTAAAAGTHCTAGWGHHRLFSIWPVAMNWTGHISNYVPNVISTNTMTMYGVHCRCKLAKCPYPKAHFIIIWAHYYACNIFRVFCAFSSSISKMTNGTPKHSSTWYLLLGTK